MINLGSGVVQNRLADLVLLMPPMCYPWCCIGAFVDDKSPKGLMRWVLRKCHLKKRRKAEGEFFCEIYGSMY
jgi:hypothetical protein